MSSRRFRGAEPTDLLAEATVPAFLQRKMAQGKSRP
jgi:hypothetical protein